jgi:hypothetical protein
MQNCVLISNPSKKFFFKCTKKDISTTSLMIMSKSGKSAYFRHIFANNFFDTLFKDFFNGFEISVKFCVFDNHIEFLKKFLAFL